MKVIVDRTTWLRGKPDVSVLLSVDDTRCCIGFACQQVGIPDEELLLTASIRALRSEDMKKIWLDHFPHCDRDQLEEAYVINDETSVSDFDRERNLIEWGEKVGIDFKFIN